MSSKRVFRACDLILCDDAQNQWILGDNRMQRKLVYCVAIVFLFPAAITWAQNRNQQQERLTQAGGLEATMKFIQDKLNSIGPVKYVAHTHDVRNGGDWTNKFDDDVSRLVANPSVCRIYYHWFTSVEEKVTMDKDVGFALYDVQKIRVLTREELFNSDNAAMGRASWTVKVESPVYVLLVQRPAPRENHFVFLDQDLANRIAKALAHAVELCGGKLNQ
jgi:hypothetical protein